jgi:hypothetical protein
LSKINLDVIFLDDPFPILVIADTIFDSEKVTSSPGKNLLPFRYTIPILI